MFVTRPLSLTTAQVWQGSSAVQGAESAVAELIGSRDRENNARARAPQGKTGLLKASIYSTPYTMNAGARVGSGGRMGRQSNYSPFVEFGTGNDFQIPVYRNLNMNQLEGYARTFKRSNGNLVNLPHRPFLFLSASEELYKMVSKIKKIKI